MNISFSAGLVAAAIATVAATTSGCAWNCTANLAPSVDVTIVDDAHCGENVTLAFSNDEGPEKNVTCSLALSNGRCLCKTSVGSEEEGQFSLRATSADGARTATTEVDVDANACHVETESVELVLK